MTQKMITLLYILLNLITIIYKTNALFSLKMIPIDSQQLNILPRSVTVEHRHQFLVNVSLARSYFANKNKANLQKPNFLESHLDLFQAWYHVTPLFISTGEHQYGRYVIVDTFADQIWFQCAGCDPCFPLTSSNVHPEDSPSYERLSLKDERCEPEINYNGTCGFEASIGVGHTRGYLGTDTMMFFDKKDSISKVLYFSNIVFGCGMHNDGFQFDNDNAITGVVGLALGPKSFISQLDYHIKGKFSYCVSPFNNPDVEKTITNMEFGDDVQIYGDAARTVEQIVMDPNSRYHLYVAGISVAGNRLQIDPELFKLDSTDFSRGFFIDIASPMTVLVPEAYSQIKLAVISHFAQYQINPDPSSASKGFDLCFPILPDESKGETYPTVAFNFIRSLGDTGEVQLVLDSNNVFYKLPDKDSGFCLAMMPSIHESGPSLFGAYQQVNYKFLFDIRLSMLSFVPQDCKETAS